MVQWTHTRYGLGARGIDYIEKQVNQGALSVAFPEYRSETEIPPQENEPSESGRWTWEYGDDAFTLWERMVRRPAPIL